MEAATCPKIRAFIAIELPKEIKELMSGWREKLQPSSSGHVSWVAPELMHLTVRFLGMVEERQIEAIAEAVGHAVEGLDGFDLNTGPLGAFPTIKKPKIIWIGLAESCQLTTISDRINATLKASGLAPETKEGKPYHPHLTICRLRREGQVEGLDKAAAESKIAAKTSFKVRELILFKSELGGKSPIYTALRRIPLDAGSPKD